MTVIEFITQLRARDIDPNTTSLADAIALVPGAVDSRASPARTRRKDLARPIMRGVFQLDPESATPKAKRK